MPDHDKTRRQPGWRVLVAATAVTLSGGAVAVVQAAEAPSARVTLDDVVPMTDVARPAALEISGSADAVILTERYDQVRELTAVPVTTDDGTVVAEASPTPNTPDPTPNTPDPTPNTPDPTPESPNTPDPTPESPNTPDASPESPD